MISPQPTLVLAFSLLGVAATATPHAGRQSPEAGLSETELTETRSPAPFVSSIPVRSATPQRPSRLAPDEVTVRVGPIAAEVLGVENRTPLPGGVVFYFDYALSASGQLQRIAGLLADAAPELLELGPVEVVVADPDPRTILPPSSQESFVRQTFERVYLGTDAEDSLRARRRRYLAAVESRPDNRGEIAEEAARDELAMVRRQTDALLLWAGRRASRDHEPRLVVLVSEGLGADPLAFYLRRDPTLSRLAATGVPSMADVGAALASLAVVPVPIAWRPGTTDPGGLRYDPTAETPVGFRIRFGGGGSRGADPGDELEEALELDYEPGGLEALVAATGGRAVPRDQGLVAALLELDSWSLVRFATSSPSAEAPEPLELVIARGGERVITPAFAPSPYSPPLVSAARVRFALADELDPTELDVASTLELDASAGGDTRANLSTTVDLSTDAEATAGGPWRFTVGVHTIADESITRSDVVTPPPSFDPANEPLRHDGGVILPAGADGAVVLAEDLASGAWGVAWAELATDLDRTSTPKKPLELLPLDSRVARGRVTFRTQTSDAVARVVFFLNGKRIARRRSPPFETSVDLGDSSRMLQLVAVAYDRNGNELDRDRLVINEPPSSFWVRITEPEPGSRPVGTTSVAASLKLPQEGELERLDFYWRDRRVASLHEPPYRTPVSIPVSDPGGFLRVEAVLTDGRHTEDVLVMNRNGFGEQIGVELVELFLVALDRDGAPVRGLEQSDFRIFEDGELQTIEAFEVAGNLPLTLGLAIDTSSSLFLRMPDVQRAAGDFVHSLDASRDRAFLVGFGSRPRLIRSTTSDLEEIGRGVDALEPIGATAIWGALQMSLEQLEGLAGRRALVVFYDGDDEDEEQAFQRSLQLARRIRVPIYLILMNNEAARTGGRSLSSRAFVNRLERIARAGGGRVFYVATDQDLGQIFEAISEELRSHYLLTYYPREEPGGPQWRPVEVEVLRRGVTARTIEGRSIYD